MKIRFDYCKGPVLGHKMRCEILMAEMRERGHEIVRMDDDVYISDTPDVAGIGVWINPTSSSTPYYWRPLGEPGPDTLTGAQYLILDPALEKHRRKEEDKIADEILVTMGGADEDRCTELVLDALKDSQRDVTVIQGPNFGRTIGPRSHRQVVHTCERDTFLRYLATRPNVICGWGTTTFEALYLGATVLPIVRSQAQQNESSNFAPGRARYPMEAWDYLRQRRESEILAPSPYKFDLLGAQRTADWIEMLYHRWAK